MLARNFQRRGSRETVLVVPSVETPAATTPLLYLVNASPLNFMDLRIELVNAGDVEARVAFSHGNHPPTQVAEFELPGYSANAVKPEYLTETGSFEAIAGKSAVIVPGGKVLIDFKTFKRTACLMAQANQAGSTKVRLFIDASTDILHVPACRVKIESTEAPIATAVSKFEPALYDTVETVPEETPTEIRYYLDGVVVRTVHITREGGNVAYSILPPED